MWTCFRPMMTSTLLRRPPYLCCISTYFYTSQSFGFPVQVVRQSHFTDVCRMFQGLKKDCIFLVIFFCFFCFSAWGSFLAICCILELKFVFRMHFGARSSHLRAHLAFGFWLWLHLASLGFTWLHLAYGFGLWFWFHLALVLAVHFTWLLAFVGF